VATADPLEPIRRAPASSVVLVDFDGTLAPIVDEPADARPEAGAVELLMDLRDRYAAVVVISGRPLDFLATVLPPELSLVGLYGLEGADSGERWEFSGAGAWREAVADVAGSLADAGLEHMRIENKGLSLTLHYRGHPDIAPDVDALARSRAQRAGLVVRPARMSIELHPPIDSDKGTVVDRYAAGAEAAMYAGDDVGDLTGFDALDRLARRGVRTVRVAVGSAEAPPALLEHADVVVGSPLELVGLLSTLR